MLRKFLLTFLFLFSVLCADGNLNVFTTDKDAEIFVDGQRVAKEQIRQHPLQSGTHYLQIKKNDTVLLSRTVTIQDNKTETVVLEDFVDYRTNVPSRGALDVEAMRVRETRGNIGLGAYGGSPASGLSVKWWPWEKFGLQAIGYINNFDDNQDSRSGVRILLALNESVYMNSTSTTFLALGSGRSVLLNSLDDDKNVIYDLQELAIGVELKISDLFASPGDERYVMVIDKDNDVLSSFLARLIWGVGEGLLKLGHLDLELGVEHTATRHLAEDKTTDHTQVKFSGGFHIYF